MRQKKIFKVVIALTLQSYAAQRKLAGIFRFLSGKYLWDLTILRSSAELTQDFIERTHASTDGYLISLHESDEIRSTLIKTRKPIVFIDDIDIGSIYKNDNAAFLKTDQVAIGKTAASHLLRQGQFAAFAFVHALGCPFWSKGRATGFTGALARRNRSVSVFSSLGKTTDTDDLTRWIKALPKPAAVFAAFDDRAVDVVNACRANSIPIPKDVMVLGSGDDELICNGCRPTLSSVKVPFEDHGFVAARELQARMLLPISKRRVLQCSNAFTVTQRMTTSGANANNLIAQGGLEFIDAYATTGIRVPDVVRHLNVSRRLADKCFQQFAGKSILQTIIEKKIKAAEKLLRDPSLSISEISDKCGFKNANYFKNVFSRTTGSSPRNWRNSHIQRKK